MLAATAIGYAAPIILVDTDPSTPLIVDPTRTVKPGTTFTVDAVITDVGLGVTPTIFDYTLMQLPKRQRRQGRLWPLPPFR